MKGNSVNPIKRAFVKEKFVSRFSDRKIFEFDPVHTFSMEIIPNNVKNSIFTLFLTRIISRGFRVLPPPVLYKHGGVVMYMVDFPPDVDTV